MAQKITRRQWLARSSGALAGAMLAGYAKGKTNVLFAEEISADTPIRMMFNENPYGPSETARKAMIAAFDEGNLYSNKGRNALRKLIAEQVGLTPDHVMLGSGSREILNIAGLWCGLEDGELVSPYPTFEALNNYTETIGVKVHRVPLDDAMDTDLEAMRKAITPKTKLVFVCNPNNPTGVAISAEKLRPFCEEISKRALVFVDEAYYEYVEHPGYRSMIELVKEGHNVLISRTASKVHGLAGLRIGFGIAHPDLIKHLSQRMTGTTNLIGVRAAIASYRDKEFQQFSLRKNREGKEIIYKLLKDTGHKYLESHTNFIFLHTGKPIKEFQETMQKRGLLVGRPFPPYLDWCRLSMAKPEEMQLFAQAFREVMG
jgi:histidinol-phosphate aminotransferase